MDVANTNRAFGFVDSGLADRDSPVGWRVFAMLGLALASLPMAADVVGLDNIFLYVLANFVVIFAVSISLGSSSSSEVVAMFMQTNSPKLNSATLVTESGQVIAESEVKQAHLWSDNGALPPLHAAISVWLFRGHGSERELLMQQRSQQKLLGAGWWANTVCGNTRHGEMAIECANRRLREEIGVVNCPLRSVGSFLYAAYGNETYGEHELDTVFVGSFDGSIELNPNEVAATTWLPLRMLVSWAKGLPFPSAQASHGMTKATLREQVTAQHFEHQGNLYLIAPWTIFMAREFSFPELIA